MGLCVSQVSVPSSALVEGEAMESLNLHCQSVGMLPSLSIRKSSK